MTDSLSGEERSRTGGYTSAALIALCVVALVVYLFVLRQWLPPGTRGASVLLPLVGFCLVLGAGICVGRWWPRRAVADAPAVQIEAEPQITVSAPAPIDVSTSFEPISALAEEEHIVVVPGDENRGIAADASPDNDAARAGKETTHAGTGDDGVATVDPQSAHDGTTDKAHKTASAHSTDEGTTSDGRSTVGAHDAAQEPAGEEAHDIARGAKAGQDDVPAPADAVPPAQDTPTPTSANDATAEAADEPEATPPTFDAQRDAAPVDRAALDTALAARDEMIEALENIVKENRDRWSDFEAERNALDDKIEKLEDELRIASQIIEGSRDSGDEHALEKPQVLSRA